MRLLLLATLATLAPAAHAQASAADIAFMRQMIPHHQQAIEMAALVGERTSNRAIDMLSERIAVSQRDEIAWMTRWLDRYAAAAPAADEHAHHAGHHDHVLMPGMLTPDEMAALAAASGAEFDRLFLEGMIRHHEGALTMVSQLLATPGAAQATEVYQIATEIDADQRADIDRMRTMLVAHVTPAPN